MSTTTATPSDLPICRQERARRRGNDGYRPSPDFHRETSPEVPDIVAKDT